jgi:hypothetical protein
MGISATGMPVRDVHQTVGFTTDEDFSAMTQQQVRQLNLGRHSPEKLHEGVLYSVGDE